MGLGRVNGMTVAISSGSDWSIVTQVNHRPWPIPTAPWLMTQSSITPSQTRSGRRSSRPNTAQRVGLSRHRRARSVFAARSGGNQDEYDGRGRWRGHWRAPADAAFRPSSRRDRLGSDVFMTRPRATRSFLHPAVIGTSRNSANPALQTGAEISIRRFEELPPYAN